MVALWRRSSAVKVSTPLWALDPGILTYLMRAQDLTGESLDDLLNKKSGLLGISGISGDMRQIVSAMNKGNGRAKLAFDIFVHRLRSGIGGMVAALGGLDALVFTAGIGENSAEVRQAACGHFGFLALEVDAAKNASAQPDRDISTASSSVRILIVRAEEDWSIARETWKLAQPQKVTQNLSP
jgi:acetate kinase